jgi:hypothetical protein
MPRANEREVVINKPPKATFTIRVRLTRMFFLRMRLGTFLLGLSAWCLNANVEFEKGNDDAQEI